jgi:hypothetical protein
MNQRTQHCRTCLLIYKLDNQRNLIYISIPLYVVITNTTKKFNLKYVRFDSFMSRCSCDHLIITSETHGEVQQQPNKSRPAIRTTKSINRFSIMATTRKINRTTKNTTKKMTDKASRTTEAACAADVRTATTTAKGGDNVQAPASRRRTP